MRTLAVAAIALLSSAGAALAAPASVSVTISPDLQAKAAKTLGQRDVNELAASLQTAVEKQLSRTGAYDGARIELVLADVTPNRPTFKQLSDTPGLSLQSFGIGGADIDGRAVAADGAVTLLRYHYMSSDIRWARGETTWSDADWAIERFASDLGHGRAVASR